jgi:hypothetical protein
MIALCQQHHGGADQGAWTKVQLRELKAKAGKKPPHEVKGKFNWMRKQLLTVAGSTCVYNSPIFFYACQQPIIWFN